MLLCTKFQRNRTNLNSYLFEFRKKLRTSLDFHNTSAQSIKRGIGIDYDHPSVLLDSLEKKVVEFSSSLLFRTICPTHLHSFSFRK